MMPKGLAYLITGLGIAACLLFLWVLSGQQPEFASTYMWLAVVTLLIGIPSRKILTGETPWWSPHAFVLATVFLYFVVATTPVVFYRVTSMAFNRPFYPRELNAGMMVVALSMASYLLGYRIGPKRMKFSDRIEWFFADTPAVQSRFDLMTIVLFVVGMGAWVFTFAAAGGIGAHLQNIGDRQETVARAGGIALHLSKWAYVGFFLYFSRHGVKPVSVAMFGTLLVVYLLFGSRNWVAMYVVGVAIIYRLRFGKIPNLVWPALLAGLAFMQSFLVLLRSTSGNLDRAEFIYSRRMQSAEGTVMSFLGDFTFIRYLADLSVSMGSVVPYQWGKTFLTFFYVIPQKFWNPRDYMEAGSEVYMRYLTPQYIKFVSVGPTLVGEFIMNFGWPGVFFVPLVLGVILRWFQSAALSHPGRQYQVAFPVIVAMVSTEMVSYIKQGSQDTTLLVYLTLPLMIPYLPNLSYLTGGAPKLESGAPAARAS